MNTKVNGGVRLLLESMDTNGINELLLKVFSKSSTESKRSGQLGCWLLALMELLWFLLF
jgi:hypothetical protein